MSRSKASFHEKQHSINNGNNKCLPLLDEYRKILDAIYRCGFDQNMLIEEYGSNLYLKYEALEEKYQKLFNINNNNVKRDENKRIGANKSYANDIDSRDNGQQNDNITIIDEVYNNSNIIDYGHNYSRNLNTARTNGLATNIKRESMSNCSKQTVTRSEAAVNSGITGRKLVTNSWTTNSESFDGHLINLETENKQTENYYVVGLYSKKSESFDKLIGYRCKGYESSLCNFIDKDLNAVSQHLKNAHKITQQFKCQSCNGINAFFETKIQLNNHIISVHQVETNSQRIGKRKRNNCIYYDYNSQDASNNSGVCTYEGYLQTKLYQTPENSNLNQDYDTIGRNGMIYRKTNNIYIAEVRSSNRELVGYCCNVDHCEYVMNKNFNQVLLHIRNVHNISNYT